MKIVQADLLLIFEVFSLCSRIFGAYTIDVIAGTAFGLETDSLVGENNPFLKAIVKMFQKSKTLGWRSAFLSEYTIQTYL